MYVCMQVPRYEPAAINRTARGRRGGGGGGWKESKAKQSKDAFSSVGRTTIAIVTRKQTTDILEITDRLTD